MNCRALNLSLTDVLPSSVCNPNRDLETQKFQTHEFSNKLSKETESLQTYRFEQLSIRYDIYLDVLRHVVDFSIQ